MSTTDPIDKLETTEACPKYDEYEDSRIDWLGRVPRNWSTTKLKFVSNIEMGNSPKSEYYNKEGEGLPFLQGNAEFDDKHPEPNRFCSAPDKTASAGDILLSVRAPVGEINVADREYGIGRGLCAITPDRGSLNEDYAYYNLFAVRSQLQLLSTGSTYDSVSHKDVAGMRVMVPPLPEQRAIAAYLDRETERIDTLIEKKERLIDLLEEKRTALISRVVTKGLDEDVEMEDSGVEWLGEIPAHWELIRLKYVSDIIAGDSPPADSYNEKGEGVPLVNGPDEYSESDYGRTREIRWTTEPTKMAPENSLLFCVRGATTGRLNIAHTDLCVGRGVAAIVAEQVQSYLNYQLMAYRPYALGIADGTTYPSVTTSLLGRSVVAMPPIYEQHAIAKYLREETAHIDTLMEQIDKGVERLQEYRTALVSAAVTGQIDVRNKV